jgi:hypothetical protein
MQNYLFISLALLFSFANGHSWLHCTDYRITNAEQTKNFQSSQCVGYGRAWSQCCENTAFGLDRGYNYQPGGGSKLCRDPLRTGNNYGASYSTGSPMAKYSPGQQVCLAWAPKNHVAASCINKNIPDNGMEVYMSGPNPTADATSLNQMTKIADWGKNPGADAYKGFHNCPNFCSDPDKATCTGCFYIPRNVQVGAVYSFIWTWEFNAVSDQYSTCWEAQIVANTQGTALALPSGYSNVASATGVTPVPPPPATSASVRTSAARTSNNAVRTSAAVGRTSQQAVDPQDTQDQQQETQDVNPQETAFNPRNQTVVYIFAGASSIAVQVQLIAVAMILAVILAQ